MCIYMNNVNILRRKREGRSQSISNFWNKNLRWKGGDDKRPIPITKKQSKGPNCVSKYLYL